MSGCYGNDPEDKHFEAMLHKWEDSQAEPDDESRDMSREREESSCDSDDI